MWRCKRPQSPQRPSPRLLRPLRPQGTRRPPRRSRDVPSLGLQFERDRLEQRAARVKQVIRALHERADSRARVRSTAAARCDRRLRSRTGRDRAAAAAPRRPLATSFRAPAAAVATRPPRRARKLARHEHPHAHLHAACARRRHGHAARPVRSAREGRSRRSRARRRSRSSASPRSRASASRRSRPSPARRSPRATRATTASARSTSFGRAGGSRRARRWASHCGAGRPSGSSVEPSNADTMKDNGFKWTHKKAEKVQTPYGFSFAGGPFGPLSIDGEWTAKVLIAGKVAVKRKVTIACAERRAAGAVPMRTSAGRNPRAPPAEIGPSALYTLVVTRLTRWVLAHRKLVVGFWIVAHARRHRHRPAPRRRRWTRGSRVPGREGWETNVEIAERYHGTGGNAAPLVPVVTLPAGQHRRATRPCARSCSGVEEKLAQALPGARVAGYGSTGDDAFASEDGRTAFVDRLPAAGPGPAVRRQPEGEQKTRARARAASASPARRCTSPATTRSTTQSGDADGPGRPARGARRRLRRADRARASCSARCSRSCRW